MQRVGKRCRELGKDAKSWEKVQEAGVRCREMGKDAESWNKMERVGKRCRGLGKDAEGWEKMQRALLVQFFCTANIVMSILALGLRANSRCQVGAAWDYEQEELCFVNSRVLEGSSKESLVHSPGGSWLGWASTSQTSML